MPPNFQIQSRAGKRGKHAIRSLPDWQKFAGPVSGDQWAVGFSALELARAWLEQDPLADLSAILDLVPDLSAFTPELGVPEAKSSLDSYRGPRTHDLLLIGTAAGGRTVVAVEGKVNEPFGQTLGKYSSEAECLLKRNPRSKAVPRLDGLTRALAGWEPSDIHIDRREQLRYQLFSAVAGTIAAGTKENAVAAVFCVHELETPRSDRVARESNASDLGRFMELLYPNATRRDAPNGWIAGPARVVNPTRRLSADVALYVAKLTTVAVT